MRKDDSKKDVRKQSQPAYRTPAVAAATNTYFVVEPVVEWNSHRNLALRPAACHAVVNVENGVRRKAKGCREQESVQDLFHHGSLFDRQVETHVE